MFPMNSSKKASQNLRKTRAGTLSEQGKRQENRAQLTLTRLTIKSSVKQTYPSPSPRKEKPEEFRFIFGLFWTLLSQIFSNRHWFSASTLPLWAPRQAAFTGRLTSLSRGMLKEVLLAQGPENSFVFPYTTSGSHLKAKSSDQIIPLVALAGLLISSLQLCH